MSIEYGIIIARCQVNYLHEGHRNLINHVKSKHKTVIIFLGCSPVWSNANPLNFISRKQMIQTTYPDINVLPIVDMALDTKWSQCLDEKISEVIPPYIKPILYGDRDSFITHYSGRFKTEEIKGELFTTSGTYIRNAIAQECLPSADFRAGIIYASQNRFPTVYSTVDIIAIKDNQILLGRKLNEDLFRCIGGFVDAQKDENRLAAAKREFGEEVKDVSVGNWRHINSFKIKDWRYKNNVDCIMTDLFICDILWGSPKPADDICEIKYFNIDENLIKNVVPAHVELITEFLKNHNKTKNIGNPA